MVGRRERTGPDFIRFFQPIIDAISEKEASATPREVIDWIIENLDIPEEELEKVNQNGRSNFENKVAFARFYLTKAGYLDGGTRGVWALSDKGRGAKIDRNEALRIFDLVQAEKNETKADKKQKDTSDLEDAAASEEIEAPSLSTDYSNRSETEKQLSKAMQSMSPQGFEEFVARTLRTLGLESVETKGGTGDEGIDGIGELLVSRFLRIRIAFQCKKYQESSAITPEKIRDFRGAISGRVDRGIFITTSRFTRAARAEAQRDNVVPIELIDLAQLIAIIIDEKIGVREVSALEVDKSFFEQYAAKQA